MAINEDYLAYVQEQLSAFGEVQIKRMFGGIGIYFDGLMFGMIGNDIFRLKVDETTEADYTAKGMEPFRTKPNTKGMPYWEVPVEVLEDQNELKIWAEKAYAVALRTQKKK